LLGTPAFPEYPSGHSSVSGAAVAVLAAYFGDDSAFEVGTDSALLPVGSVKRSFTKFSDALREVSDSRVAGGIHFRSATDDGEAQGRAVGGHVFQKAMKPARTGCESCY
jgi:hypothetical protein